MFYNRQLVKWKIKNLCFSLRGNRAKFEMHCILYEGRKMHIWTFRGINIRRDAGKLGLKWAWLFKMKTFSPWNLLLLTLAECSVTLLNWRLFWRLKWAGGDVEIMPVRSQPGSLPGLCTRYFHIKLNVQKNLNDIWHIFLSFGFTASLWSATVEKKGGDSLRCSSACIFP